MVNGYYHSVLESIQLWRRHILEGELLHEGVPRLTGHDISLRIDAEFSSLYKQTRSPRSCATAVSSKRRGERWTHLESWLVVLEWAECFVQRDLLPLRCSFLVLAFPSAPPIPNKYGESLSRHTRRGDWFTM